MQKRRAESPPLVFMYLSVGPRSVRRPHIPGVENGELFPERPQEVHVDTADYNRLFLGTDCRIAPVGIYKRRMAAVAAPRVAPDTVNPGDIALVLDGARPQQRIPYGDARRRPVGRIDYHVIVAAIAGEYGEPEIIAYLEQYPYAAPLDNHTPAARRIMVRLTAHGEEMALVVILRTAVGANEIHAVEISALFGHGHTPRNGGIVTHGHTASMPPPPARHPRLRPPATDRYKTPW